MAKGLNRPEAASAWQVAQFDRLATGFEAKSASGRSAWRRFQAGVAVTVKGAAGSIRAKIRAAVSGASEASSPKWSGG